MIATAGAAETRQHGLTDIAKGEQVGPTIRHDGAVRGVSVQPRRTDSAPLRAMTARRSVWDIASGKPCRPGHDASGLCLRDRLHAGRPNDRDGHALDGVVRGYRDAATGRELRSVMRHSNLVWSVGLQP